MRRSLHPDHLLRMALLALPLTLGLAACETLEKLNPFEERKVPLQGERKAVFPSGVPGVEFNAPPPQPMNSNVPINPALKAEENPDRPAGEPSSASSAASKERQPAAKSASRPVAKSAAKSATQTASKPAAKADQDDPWAGQR